MKKSVEIIGIFYGKSKAGKAYRVLYLIDHETLYTDSFEGQSCYKAYAPDDVPYTLGQIIDIVYHKGEAIVIA